MVFLKLHLYRKQTIFKRDNQKLASQYYGPYPIIQKVGHVAYKLQLPDGACIHPVFHVSLLKKYVGDSTDASTEVPPITDEGVLILEPEAILDTRWVKEGKKVNIPKWYQSLGMDSPVERLEQDVGSLMTGQQQVIEKITELFDKLAALTDQSTKQPVREQAESSQNQQRANVGRFNGNGGSQQSGYCSYTPKLVKLDFPCFNGGEDPTSWLCRTDQFFDFHETPEGERVALASFHLEGDV
ncbi:hypothetical protein F0562_034385 [Nyssa sinensis]|uniref:Tf2-1-like SH3-like domain-containing protein n=1 Tax=Nyssa sinensis TaxID=561372 RepID=A0A5J5AJG1_9ASTE|nr:hypothetical protein F0562_034385 [Nyssa sinensis]